VSGKKIAFFLSFVVNLDYWAVENADAASNCASLKSTRPSAVVLAALD